jgi:hypothetical protein
MGMGMAMAKQIGDAIAGQAGGAATPPPIPKERAFYVVRAGQQAGPFPTSELQRQIQTGELARASLVWTQGMSEWSSAEAVPDLAHLFAATPPPIPKGSA